MNVCWLCVSLALSICYCSRLLSSNAVNSCRHRHVVINAAYICLCTSRYVQLVSFNAFKWTSARIANELNLWLTLNKCRLCCGCLRCFSSSLSLSYILAFDFAYLRVRPLDYTFRTKWTAVLFLLLFERINLFNSSTYIFSEPSSLNDIWCKNWCSQNN